MQVHGNWQEQLEKKAAYEKLKNKLAMLHKTAGADGGEARGGYHPGGGDGRQVPRKGEAPTKLFGLSKA
jgi:hypothetical protein